jgi:hypothetical protein
MKLHDVVSFKMPIKKEGILVGHKGTIVYEYPNIYNPQNYEVEVKTSDNTSTTVMVHESWIQLADDRPRKKLESEEFLKHCDYYKNREGDLTVLSRKYGAFQWLMELYIEGEIWRFDGQAPMWETDKGYGGKATYVKSA